MAELLARRCPDGQTRGRVMKLGLCSDIHGNISGLKAVLAHIDALGGVDRFVAAGDIVGGGPGAEDLLDLLRERGATMLRGNSEEVALHVETTIRRVPERFKAYQQDTVEWLRANLSQPYWELLAALPLTETIEVAPGRTVLICHATPRSCWEPVCSPNTPADALRTAYGQLDADVVIYGHWHGSHVLSLDGKLLVNVASVGLRKDGLSAFSVIEYTDERWIIQQYQIPYDTKEEAKLMIRREVPQP
jgi:predicted phosphodiesterase